MAVNEKTLQIASEFFRNAIRPCHIVDLRLQPITDSSLVDHRQYIIASRSSLVDHRQYIIAVFFTDMHRLTTGIRSEKCVVRRFRRCANVIE